MNIFSFYCSRKAATSAKHLLTKKTFGGQHGGGYLRHHFVEELNLHFTESLETIGSEDQFYPRGARYSLQYNLGGLKTEIINFQVILSNMD